MSHDHRQLPSGSRPYRHNNKEQAVARPSRATRKPSAITVNQQPTHQPNRRVGRYNATQPAAGALADSLPAAGALVGSTSPRALCPRAARKPKRNRRVSRYNATQPAAGALADSSLPAAGALVGLSFATGSLPSRITHTAVSISSCQSNCSCPSLTSSAMK